MNVEFRTNSNSCVTDHNVVTSSASISVFRCCEFADGTLDDLAYQPAPTSFSASPEQCVERPALRNSLGPLLALAAALFPKCPLCAATYLSLSGLAAMPHLPAFYWLFPLLVLLMLANLVSMWLGARRRKRYAGLCLAIGGTAVILIGGVAFSISFAPGLGVALMLTGAFVSVVETGKFPMRMLGARDDRRSFLSLKRE